MPTAATTAHTGPATAGTERLGTVAATVLRLAGAGLLATNSLIHGHLWADGYRTIDTIGTLFLLDAIAGWVLAAAVLATPRRRLAPVAVVAALMEFGTVAGLYLSTKHTLAGFVESSMAPYYWESAVTELIGTVVLLALAVLAFTQTRRRRTHPRW